MNGTHLTGLEGTNPLGFLAALGVQAVFMDEDERPRLWWSTDVTPHAIVNDSFTVERIADQALSLAVRWRDCSATNPRRLDGTPIPKGDELKLAPEDIRTYLCRSYAGETGSDLAAALLAEGSLDNSGVAKPSDLYFTAGQMKFLGMTRTLLGTVVRDEILTGLVGPWAYASELPSLGWDVADDRVYALRANNPAPDKKLTNPGPEALAIFGLSRHAVFGARDRTLTQGCSGSWKTGYYSWPLWHRPATSFAVKSLMAHACDDSSGNRSRWYPSWGVSCVLRSPIRRSSQGGYGTFGPPEVVWQKD